MVVFGKAACKGTSAPTPFWRRAMDVVEEMMGRSISARDGVESSRDLFAHRTVRWVQLGRTEENVEIGSP